MGGQFSLATNDTAPASMNASILDDVLRITMTHLGRTGDSAAEFATLELLLEGCYGDACTPAALTNAQANELFDEMRIYRDDGDGSFNSGSDALVSATITNFSLTNGVQTVTFNDGGGLLQVDYGTPRTYFVVLDRVDARPASPTVNRFQITHVTEASSTAQDRSSDIRLTLQYVQNVASDIIQILGPTAVRLQAFSVSNSGTQLLQGIAFLIPLLLLPLVVIIRKRRKRK